MKANCLKLCLALSIAVILFSCKKNDSTSSDTTNQSKFDKTLLIGWWNSTFNVPSYKRYYFGADSTYIQDESNYGLTLRYAKWWNRNDTIFVNNYYTTSPVSYSKIVMLTKDSLKFAVGTTTVACYK